MVETEDLPAGHSVRCPRLGLDATGDLRTGIEGREWRARAAECDYRNRSLKATRGRLLKSAFLLLRIMPSREDKKQAIPLVFKESPRRTRHYSEPGKIPVMPSSA